MYTLHVRMRQWAFGLAGLGHTRLLGGMRIVYLHGAAVGWDRSLSASQDTRTRLGKLGLAIGRPKFREMYRAVSVAYMLRYV